MKKVILSLLTLLVFTTLMACGNKISVGGGTYEEDLVTSGYYLDKASLSDATFVETLSNIKEIKKPSSLGKVTLPDLSTIELTVAPIEEVTEADIEAELERERDQETTYKPVTEKRKAKLTDKVIIDFKGFVGGKEFEGGEATDFELVLGSGQFIPGFEDQVVGHNAGSKFSINVKFPDDYKEELAGKNARFDITIKSIEEATKPEVDNNFVVAHTKKNSFNVNEYKEELKERLIKEREFMYNESMVFELSTQLLEKATFEPTEEALAWQFSAIMAMYNEQAQQSGSNLATLIASSGQSVMDVYKQIKEYAPEAIKSEMLIDELKKSYKVSVTDDEVKEWFTMLADAYNYGSQFNYDEYVQQIGFDNLKKSVESEKILIEAAKKCKVVEKKEEE